MYCVNRQSDCLELIFPLAAVPELSSLVSCTDLRRDTRTELSTGNKKMLIMITRFSECINPSHSQVGLKWALVRHAEWWHRIRGLTEVPSAGGSPN